MDAAMKITKARTAMLQSQRFYGKLALDLVPRPSSRYDTLATNGRDLFFNPAWVDAQPMPKLIGAIAHEVCHVANLHHTRRRGRDAEQWNVAADLAINPILRNAGFDLPDGALFEPTFEGKSVEEIYRLREQKPKQEAGQGQGKQPDGGQGGDKQGQDQQDPNQQDDGEPGQPGGDPGGCGEILDAVNEDGSEPSPAELTRLEAEEQVNVAQAYHFAKQAGQSSTDQDRMLEDLKKAQQDWKEELRRFIIRNNKSDASWARPNRRLINQGLYLPSLHSEAMGELVVAVDLSGSVTEWIADFCAELAAIKEETKPSKLTVLYFTDRVVKADTFNEDEELVIKPCGSGGTDFRPLFAYIENHDLNPDCTIVLTDLIASSPKDAPLYPVLWAATDRSQKEPWGERIDLKRA